MFKVGDKVKTLAVECRTDLANKVYANRDAIVTEVTYPYGNRCYRIKYDEPFEDCGEMVETHFYYDFENGLVLR